MGAAARYARGVRRDGRRCRRLAAELAAASDLVCVCVVGDADVEEVVTGPRGILAGLRPGGVLDVLSTVHPRTCRSLAAQVRARSADLVDAPVSGGDPAAAEDRLLVMVGGDTGTVERCRPVFGTYGRSGGPPGPGRGRAAHQAPQQRPVHGNLATAASALTLAGALEVDPARLAEVIGHGSGASFALDRITAAGGTLDRIAARTGSRPAAYLIRAVLAGSGRDC